VSAEIAAQAGTATSHAPRSKTELFVAFTWLALQGFGGVLAVAQRELVERRRWLNHEQFVELLSLSQVLPGPNVINLALMFGDRHFGWRGAVAAVAGMLGVPLLIVLALATLYTEFSAVPQVAGALRGMSAVAAGMILATAVRLGATLKRNAMGLWPCALIVLASALAIGWLRWPLVWMVLTLGVAGFAWAWRQLARQRRGA